MRWNGRVGAAAGALLLGAVAPLPAQSQPAAATITFAEAVPLPWMAEVFPEGTTARRLANGGVIAGSPIISEVRHIGSDHRKARVVGRQGYGAGQFNAIHSVVAFSDGTVGIADPGHMRLSVYDGSGRIRRTASLTPPGGDIDGSRPQVHVLGMFADGRYLAWLKGMRRTTSKDEVRADSALLMILNKNGRVQERLGWFRGPGFYAYSNPSPIVVDELPLRPRIAIAVGSESYFFSTGAEYLIAEYRPDGSLVRTFGAPDPPSAVAASSLRRWKRGRLAQVKYPRLREAMAQALEWVSYPVRLPGYRSLMHDDTGRLWAERFALPGDPIPWDVYSPEGRVVARAESPPDGSVQWIAGGEAVVAFEMADGRVRFARYRLDLARE